MKGIFLFRDFSAKATMDFLFLIALREEPLFFYLFFQRVFFI